MWQREVGVWRGARGEGTEASLCHAYHAKLRQMQMRSLYSARRERDREGGAVQAPAVPQGGREQERGVMLLCSPQTLEACCLCASRKLMLQTGGGFLAETKEYQSAFQGVTRQLAVSEGEAGGSSRDG